jgi:hypothetical protein
MMANITGKAIEIAKQKNINPEITFSIEKTCDDNKRTIITALRDVLKKLKRGIVNGY